MATHTPFHNESTDSANAAGDAVDEYLHKPALQDPGFAAAIATDAGYSQLRKIISLAIGNYAKTQHDAELAQVIGFMAEDKSNDWSEEIAVLGSVEVELLALRAKVAQYEANIGPSDNVEAAGHYAQLGEFTAALLGANEEWDIAFPEYMAEHWLQVGGQPSISDQNEAALTHWRAIADRLGIEHDALEEDTEEEDEEELCAEDGCENSLDDGEGYDGYCGEHADQRERDGVFGHEDHVDSDADDRLCGCGARHAVHTDDQEGHA